MADSGAGGAAAVAAASEPAAKSRIEDLTLFSRRDPLFAALLPVGRPNMGDKAEFMRLLDAMWESRMLANRGPMVQALSVGTAITSASALALMPATKRSKIGRST